MSARPGPCLTSSRRGAPSPAGAAPAAAQPRRDGCLRLLRESQLSRFCVRPGDRSGCLLAHGAAGSG